MHTKNDLLELLIKSNPTHKWIDGGLIFLSVHGSRAYNTHTDESDYDYKGIVIPPKQYLYSFFRKFEQAILSDPNPDTTVYALDKFFRLAAACNPNIIEVMFTDPADYIYISKIGQKLIEHRGAFLSKRIKYTMCGYAYEQKRRLERHRNWMLRGYKEPPTRESLGLPSKPLIEKSKYEAVSAIINKELSKYNFDFLDDCPEPTKIAIRNSWHDMLVDLDIKKDDQWMAAARSIGLNDNFIEIIQQERFYVNSREDYKKYLDWQFKRNRERYETELKYGMCVKHAYHIVRLIRMCREVLLTGKVLVKRPDREELLAIRNGEWTYEQLIEFITKAEIELQEIWAKTTILPEKPDMKILDSLYSDLIEEFLIAA